MITGVALLVDGEKYFMSKPFRHNDLMKSLQEKGISIKGAEEGFVTDKTIFLDRAYAEMHARTVGQLKKKCIGSILTSEDLW